MQIHAIREGRGFSAAPGRGYRSRLFAKMMFVMRLTAFLLTLTALQLNAREVASQHHAAVKVTYEARNEPLEKVFAAVRKQTGYFFFYQPKWLCS
ncbi:hypothetical protein AWW69_04695 [Bacillus cereus]|nr:hypothetical protein AWW69_04695 [Bacillus cereus]